MRHGSIGLRSSAALLALMIGSAAAAQSTLPPTDVAQNPATTASEPSPGGEIVVTGSRIRRDPLSQDAPIVFVDEADIAKTGLNSINDVLQRLPSSGGGLNGKFNNSGNLGNPPDGGGVGAGAALRADRRWRRDARGQGHDCAAKHADHAAQFRRPVPDRRPGCRAQ